MKNLLGRGLKGSSQFFARLHTGTGHCLRTSRYLAARSQFQPRRDDIWIATYPRSGTTWLQYLTYLLVHGAPTGDELRFKHIHDVSPWFERSLASGQHTAESLEALASPRIFKTHLPHRWLPEGGRKIHMFRDLENVVESYFRLHRDYLGYTRSLDAFVEDFCAGDVQYESWFDHEAEWRDHARDPGVLMLNYEDAIRDTPACVASLADFCQVSCNPETIDRIVSATSKVAMKAQEQRFDHAELLLIERGIRRGHFIGPDQQDTDQGSVGAKLNTKQRQRLRTVSQHHKSTPDSAMGRLFRLHRHLM